MEKPAHPPNHEDKKAKKLIEQIGKTKATKNAPREDFSQVAAGIVLSWMRVTFIPRTSVRSMAAFG